MTCKPLVLALFVMSFATACSHDEQARSGTGAPADSVAARDSMSSDPRSAHIVCYSGSEIIYVGDSTPDWQPSVGADGVSFKDAKTGYWVRITGTCIVTSKS